MVLHDRLDHKCIVSAMRLRTWYVNMKVTGLSHLDSLRTRENGYIKAEDVSPASAVQRYRVYVDKTAFLSFLSLVDP